jgi:DNA mismatch repair protein MSH6
VVKKMMQLKSMLRLKLLLNHNENGCLLDAKTFSCANFCRSQPSNHDSFPKSSPSSTIFTDTNRKGLQTDTKRKGLQKKAAAAFEPVVKAKDNAVNFKETVNRENMFLVENDDDITGPETPGMQPLTSNVKRSREDGTKLSSLRDSGKRVRFLDDALALDMTKKELEVASKFEWLDPSRIRDANGRRPSDPLYDKTTLYIPPEVMRKMTASQKQYWSVKCKYMDVVLFFKVVSESSTLNIDIFFLYTLWYIYLLLVFFIHYL